jgi:hypothetical protein
MVFIFSVLLVGERSVVHIWGGRVTVVEFTVHSGISGMIHSHETMIFQYLGQGFCHISLTFESRDSSVSIALGFGLEDRGSSVRFPAGDGNFSLHHRDQNGSGAHPTSYPLGTRALSLGVKRSGREADHSSPSSAEVKECVELYIHSPIRLHGVVLS